MGCCGGARTARRRRAVERTRLPPNPAVRDGTRLIYLGGETRTVAGTSSGLTYHVSPHRRYLDVHPADADDLVADADFILEP